MEQYFFLVGILGTLVNFLLALGAAQLSGCPLRWNRLLIAALIGGLQVGLCVFSRFRFLSDVHWRLMSLLIMAFLAFGWDLGGLMPGAVFVLLRLAMDGVSDGGLWPAILFGALILLLCRARDDQHGNFAGITILHKDHKVEVTALLDTGNTLTDPISGDPVLVVSSDVAYQLLQLRQEDLASPLETLARQLVPGLRLIPYTAIGVPGGMLLGIRPEQVSVNGEDKRYILAFAPQRIGQGKGYQALAGGNV